MAFDKLFRDTKPYTWRRVALLDALSAEDRSVLHRSFDASRYLQRIVKRGLRADSPIVARSFVYLSSGMSVSRGLGGVGN